MSPEQRIEEAHGLWELCVARVAAMAELLSYIEMQSPLLSQAVKDERVAFSHWQNVSKEAGA